MTVFTFHLNEINLHQNLTAKRSNILEIMVGHVMEHLIITSRYLHHGQIIIQIALIHRPFDVFCFVVVHKNNRKKMTMRALNSPLLTLATMSLISWDYIAKHWKMSTSSLVTIVQSIEDLLALSRNLSLDAVPTDWTWRCQTFCIMRVTSQFSLTRSINWWRNSKHWKIVGSYDSKLICSQRERMLPDGRRHTWCCESTFGSTHS